MKTAKQLGIKSVAVFSEADRYAKHVAMADEAYLIGPAPSSESYLRADKIIEVAKKTGAQAIHPGYGFLSENAAFADELAKQGIEFIGPPSDAIIAMGSKSKSKEIMEAAGLPCVPGYHGKNQDPEFLREEAGRIGYPILIKAVSGGGGKGMRVVTKDDEFESALRSAKGEAMKSFSDDVVLLEKYIPEGRHVEVQVFADKHGTALHLFERDCSIQRRHQKVIEEAPAPNISEALRRDLGEKAVAAAKAVGYHSAGTVEFLLFGEDFYFLEMNTRLQVEHPITEMITGVDLVEQMLRIAAGEKISYKQEDIKVNGWAFESRVYAEDPEKYLPSIGTLSRYIEPTSTLGANDVRCDSGIVEGSEISIYYDPMICKLVTHGKDRNDALKIMQKALDAYVIKGVTHNIPLLRDVIVNERFVSGNISTKFLPQEYPEGFKGHRLTEQTFSELASVAAIVHAKRDMRNYSWGQGKEALMNEEINSLAPTEWKLSIQVTTEEGGLQETNVEVKRKASLLDAKADEYEISADGKPAQTVHLDWALESPIIQAHFAQQDPVTLQYIDALPLGFRLQHYGTKFDVTVLNPTQRLYSQFMIEKPKLDMSKVILSPMPGSVVSVAVKVGDTVAEGAEVAVVEAMKMANILRAPRVGKIKAINVEPGSPVAADEIIIEFEDEAAA